MSRSVVPDELLDPVVAYFGPQRVILFGSAARGQAGPDSDVDLLVIVDDETPTEKVTLAAGYEARRSYRRAADVIPIRRSTFERKRRARFALPTLRLRRLRGWVSDIGADLSHRRSDSSLGDSSNGL